MSSANHSFSKLSTIALALAMTFASGISVVAQTATVGNVQITGVPDDWTHHHLVFSDPGTEQDAIRQGKHDQWLKIVNDPRYVIQQLRRGTEARGPAAADVARIRQAARTAGALGPQVFATDEFMPDPFASAASKAKKTKITKDWSTNLGSGTTATALTGVIGTLNSSSVSSSSTLTVDGVTFTASPPVVASLTGTFSAEPASNSTLTITGLGNTLVLTATASTSSTSCTFTSHTSTVDFVRSSTINTNAVNLAALINIAGCGSAVGVSAAAPGSAAVDISALTAGLGGDSITLKGSNSTPKFNVFSGTNDLANGSDGTNSRTTFAYWTSTTYASPSTMASNIATAIGDNSTVSAVLTATANLPASGDVTFAAKSAGTGGNAQVTESGFSAFSPSSGSLSGGSTATVQPNAYPAKYGVSLTSASCSDFAIYPTGGVGGSGAATIIAYDKLYSGSTGTGGCGTTGVPAVYWAYNTATGYSVTTSPIISLDGTQVAFIESNGSTASLVLIKWAAETGETVSSPKTLTNQASGSAYNSCTPTAAAPCMYTIAFANGQDDTFSAPFSDYRGDAIYVGDDGGNLHQFTGVFLGAPAENMSSPWPVPLGGNQLASPVYDATYNAVFVGDLGGGLYCLTTNNGSPAGCQSSQTNLGGGWYKSGTTISGGQIADAPLINSSANYLLAFVNTSTANTIYGHSEQYFPSSSPGIVGVGTGATGYYLYAGNYDNVYYDSPNNTGNVYVVGNTGATTGATLYQVGLSGGFLNGTVTGVATGLTASGAYPWPSPVTEFCNNGANPCAALQSFSGCTVPNNSATLTCTSGGFTSADVGAPSPGRIYNLALRSPRGPAPPLSQSRKTVQEIPQPAPRPSP